MAISAHVAARGRGEAGPGTVTLARIVGNDLYPRHAEGQALQNLATILEREPDFPDCTKLFVVNRMFDPAAQQEAERLVAGHGHSTLVIPFSGEEYAAQTCDTSAFGGDEHFESAAFLARDENSRDRDRLWACRAKICYAMNVNGARNAALDWGRQRSDWTLVLDGSCFVSQAAWDQIRRDMSSLPFVPHLIVPMRRLPSNADLDHIAPSPNTEEEPQIAMHRTARERFDERYPYALRNKTSLFERLGVPGPWSNWERLPWLPETAPAADRYLYKFSNTCVFRLTSGIEGGSLEQRGAHGRRYQGRNKGVFRTLAMLDDRFGAGDRKRALRIMGLADGSPTSSLAAPARRPVRLETLRERTLVVGLGAMKSGTTWLSDYLRGNPDFFHSPVNEMNVFNEMYENPFRDREEFVNSGSYRLFRMEEILLNPANLSDPRRLDQLRAFAQIGRIRSVDAYLDYFAERIGGQRCFGEICTAYSHLPADALREIAEITADVRFLFLMRDPALRAASHVRHARRRVSANVPIAEIVARVGPDDPEFGHIYLRSDYGHTIDQIEEAGLRDRTRFLTFETLFREDTMRDLCEWLGVEYRTPRPDRKMNEGRGDTLSPGQLAELRERLDPIYVDLRARGLAAQAPGWWWDAPPPTAG